MKYFKKFRLSNAQAKALIFVREVGAIDNSAYRSLNHVDTLIASTSLRQLKEMELLAAKNQGSATYYVAGLHFLASLSQETKQHMAFGKEHMCKEQMNQTASINNVPSDIVDMIKKPILNQWRKLF